jgi:hypothetical protein
VAQQHHLGDQVLEARPRHAVVRLVHEGIRVQLRILHDPVDEVVDDRGDAVHAAQTFVQ